jgi:hypothetical protein
VSAAPNSIPNFSFSEATGRLSTGLDVSQRASITYGEPLGARTAYVVTSKLAFGLVSALLGMKYCIRLCEDAY